MNDITFSSLGLNEGILATLQKEGYEQPTPIQQEAIPMLLAGRDLLGCAQTGTGKTAAFALPIIQRLTAVKASTTPRSARTLVVAPTRELAAQIDASFATYARSVRLTRACLFGGVGKHAQVRALARGVDVLVATPGRLLDLCRDGAVRLDRVETVVLDEADRMFDMGFIHDIRRIVALLPRLRQTVLFSATMPDAIAKLADSILRDPVRIAIAPTTPAADLVKHSVMFVRREDKRALLGELLGNQAVERSIVFTRTKHGADRLAELLEQSGLACGVIHANKSQNERTRTLDSFRGGRIKVLVATDLAARGIDVDAVTHVFNYDLPQEPETYVHRVGRTARAGLGGTAVTLCAGEERQLLAAVERYVGRRIPIDTHHPYAASSGTETSPTGARRTDRSPRGSAPHGFQQARRPFHRSGPSFAQRDRGRP